MNLVFLINIILVKQMVREAGFKDWSFLAMPLCDTSQTRERRSAIPASTILIHIRPKKDTRIFINSSYQSRRMPTRNGGTLA